MVKPMTLIKRLSSPRKKNRNEWIEGMTDTIHYKNMEDDITRIFREHGDTSEMPIHQYLEDELKALEPSVRTAALDKLIHWFDLIGPEEKTCPALSIDDPVLAKMIKLLLGRDITQVDAGPDKLLESLAESINTVFKSLNQLIGSINTTLMGKQGMDETIRQVIGYHLEGTSQTKTLESYIGQIGKAFFESQEASKKAAYAKVMQILEELSPGKIEKEADISRLSPMRKSRYYEVYELKFKKFEKWFESGRFMESFLREFERNCQKISF